MDLLEKVKQALTPSEEVVATSVPEVSASVVSSPQAGPAEMTTESTTWNTFVESMDSARKRAGEMLTIPAAAAPDTSAVGTTVKSWWSEATAFFEETRITVEEKISEMTGPAEIKNDPLRSVRSSLSVYTDALEQLKQEAFNLGLAAENMARLGSGALGRTVGECFGEQSTVRDHFVTYKEKHEKVVIPILEEVRLGVETVTAMIAEETTKIQSVLVRFKRRDRLHQSVLDMKSRVDIRREKNNRRVADGFTVDSKSMEELYELTRTMDSIESDFRITSEQLIAKCEELIKNKSRSFHAIFLKFVEVQNTFFYRIGGSCSIPFADMHEAFKSDIPSEDEMEDLGSHPLTWRGDTASPEQGATEYMPLKTAPLRRSTTVSINKTDLTTNAPAGLTTSAVNNPTSPNRYSYRRPSSSPIRKAGTSALLEEVSSPQ